MRKWNRTVIEWECFLGLTTDIEVTDMQGEHEKLFHKILKLQILSLPKPSRALVETTIFRCSIAPTTERSTILQRLKSLAGDQRNVSVLYGAEPYGQFFRMLYAIPSGKQFCDWAIDWTGRFLEVLGVNENRIHRQACFKITQQTFVFHDGKWVDFAWWLREERYNLPQMSGKEEILLEVALMP